MATARGPRGAPDSGARITKDRVQLPGQRKAHGRWPACRVRHAGLRACPCAAPGAGPRDAACGVCQQPGGGRGCITSRLIIRLRESRTHDVLRARPRVRIPSPRPPAIAGYSYLPSSPRVTEVRAMSRHIPHTTMSKFTLCLRALPVILIFLVLVRARCHGVASRCEHRRELLREARGVSSGRR